MSCWTTKKSIDWYEMQTIETIDSRSDHFSDTQTMIKKPKDKKYSFKVKNMNQLLEKWGESIGIFDERDWTSKTFGSFG